MKLLLLILAVSFSFPAYAVADCSRKTLQTLKNSLETARAQADILHKAQDALEKEVQARERESAQALISLAEKQEEKEIADAAARLKAKMEKPDQARQVQFLIFFLDVKLRATAKLSAGEIAILDAQDKKTGEEIARREEVMENLQLQMIAQKKVEDALAQRDRSCGVPVYVDPKRIREIEEQRRKNRGQPNDTIF